MELGRFVGIVAGCALFSGEANAADFGWRHSSLRGNEAQQQFTVDKGDCTATAYKSVGGPPAPSTNTGRDPNQFWSGYTQAQAQQRYQTAYDDIFNGCMARRGWALVPLPR
jgi:hypothetical protein